MLFGGVPIALIIGIGLHDGGVRQFLLQKLLHPRAGKNIRSVLFAGMQLHADLARHRLGNSPINFPQSLRREVTGEVDHGFFAAAGFVRDIVLPARGGNSIFLHSDPPVKRFFSQNSARSPSCGSPAQRRRGSGSRSDRSADTHRHSRRAWYSGSRQRYLRQGQGRNIYSQARCRYPPGRAGSGCNRRRCRSAVKVPITE